MAKFNVQKALDAGYTPEQIQAFAQQSGVELDSPLPQSPQVQGVTAPVQTMPGQPTQTAQLSGLPQPLQGAISPIKQQYLQAWKQAPIKSTNKSVPTQDDIATTYKNATGEDLLGGTVQPKLSVQDQKIEQAKTNADRIVTQLEQQYFGKQNKGDVPLYTSDIPLINIIQGLYTKEQARLPGANPQAKTYLNTLETVKPFLAKAAGQTGQLNEKEQERAVKQLPTTFSTQDDAIRGFSAFRLMMGLPPSTVYNSTQPAIEGQGGQNDVNSYLDKYFPK